jgi:predicted transglutaminase-like cysteine proteinase
MFKKIVLAVAAIAGMSFAVATDANAWGLGSAARNLDPSANSRPPLQFQIFCLQNPAECRRSRVSTVSYTPRVRHLLSSINDQVNRQIRPRSEKVDVWSIAATTGDCDDYVMTKRHRLIRAGVPASALRVAVVKTAWGEGHAVLVVKTSSGEYVLDNIRKSIVPRSASGYRYITVASADPAHWSR